MHELSPAKSVFAMRSMYFILWGSNFIGNNYFPVLLRSFSFTSDFSVGLIISLGSLIATVSQLCWGKVADHAKTKNTILSLALLGVSLSFTLFFLPRHTSLVSAVPCAFFFYSFLTIPGLLTDTVAVENTDKFGVPFGKLKCFASAGAGSAGLVLFLLSLAVTMKPGTAFTAAFVFSVLAQLPLRFLPATQGHAYGLRADAQSKANTSFRVILQNRRMALLLCFILLMFVGIQGTNTFFSIYYTTSEGLNAGLGMLGLFNAICIAVETCLMLFGNRIIQAVKIHHLFPLVCLAACSRSLIYYFAPNIYLVQISAISHTLLFGPLWSRLSPYVNDIVPKELRATAQAAVNMMFGGLGPMLGSALGGVVAQNFGIRTLFLVTGAMLFVIALVFYFLFKRQYQQDLLTDAVPQPV